MKYDYKLQLWWKFKSFNNYYDLYYEFQMYFIHSSTWMELKFLKYCFVNVISCWNLNLMKTHFTVLLLGFVCLLAIVMLLSSLPLLSLQPKFISFALFFILNQIKQLLLRLTLKNRTTSFIHLMAPKLHKEILYYHRFHKCLESFT